MSLPGLIKTILPLLDLLAAPLVWPAALLLKLVRRTGVQWLPLCRRVLLGTGVFPVVDHYFEPRFDYRALRHPLDRDRTLPGIAWNEAGQLSLLDEFRYADELRELAAGGGFDFDNGSFRGGDADFLYSLIRLKQPRRLVEIGSGNSTRIAIQALRRNAAERPGYACRHVCIEPFEAPWLEQAGVAVLRQKVEEVDRSLFAELEAGDLLFIDSTHVIRPQGDVLFEYLELLPTLPPGVIVHVHDIFTPRDYLPQMLVDQVRFWNEQYLLEAFLTGNPGWRIIGAVNWLRHRHFDRLREKCPLLNQDEEPGSFYMQKVV